MSPRCAGAGGDSVPRAPAQAPDFARRQAFAGVNVGVGMRNKAEGAVLALPHGAAKLPRVRVESYNEELRDPDGFVGDRASKRAFSAILEDWRERLRRLDEDPFGDTPSAEITKGKLDKVLTDGEPEAAGLIQGAIEEFAAEFAAVLRRFRQLKSWRGVKRVAVGGGLRGSRIGELAIGRAGVLLKTEGVDVDLVLIHHHPDEAALIGAGYLVPRWMLSGHDGFLAVDIGGTNMRAGIVTMPKKKKQTDLSKAEVARYEVWRHADDKPKREEAVERLVGMLKGLLKHAKKSELVLAPFIGVACPGIIREDGTIERGGQNLPGNWESSRFSLPQRLAEGVGRIDDHPVTVLMHNDAVVQGLSELPFMAEVERWGVFTIGTGLGNAVFTNTAEDDA